MTTLTSKQLNVACPLDYDESDMYKYKWYSFYGYRIVDGEIPSDILKSIHKDLFWTPEEDEKIKKILLLGEEINNWVIKFTSAHLGEDTHLCILHIKEQNT